MTRNDIDARLAACGALRAWDNWLRVVVPVRGSRPASKLDTCTTDAEAAERLRWRQTHSGGKWRIVMRPGSRP